MGLLQFLGLGRPKAGPHDAPKASTALYAEEGFFYDLNDPRVIEFLRDGNGTAAGVTVTIEQAMRVPAVFRCVSLISNSIGMLPLHLIDKQTKAKASDHPAFRLLHRKPNSWQTAYGFRSLMQSRALLHGNAYALIVRSRGDVKSLVPLDPRRVETSLDASWNISYRYERPAGGSIKLSAEDVLHIHGMSDDGVVGQSPVRQAAEAIGLAIAADGAAGNLFRNGSLVGGTLNTDDRLDDDVVERIRADWDGRYSGSENAGRTPILEEGLKYTPLGPSAKDSQHIETRARQVEEIGRVFGVPRPLLMVDETSWGSGIDVLGQFFVRYALNPWFEAWQQAIELRLLTDAEAAQYEAKFNAGALERGNMAAQADYFAKARGAGGHQPWMSANEVRNILDLPEDAGGDGLTNPMTTQNAPKP